MPKEKQSAAEKQKKLNIIATTMRDADKLKRVMMKRGITKARAKCPIPKCDGMLHGELYKGRSPSGMCIRMKCDGECQRSMIE